MILNQTVSRAVATHVHGADAAGRPCTARPSTAFVRVVVAAVARHAHRPAKARALIGRWHRMVRARQGSGWKVVAQ
jgi:hypothetical protein